MLAQDKFKAQAAPIEAMAFSTWKPMAPFCVSGTSTSEIRTCCAPSLAMMCPSSTYSTRLPWARWVARVGLCGSMAKKVTWPGQLGAMATTIGSAAFSTAMPLGATFCTMTRFNTAKSSTVLM